MPRTSKQLKLKNKSNLFRPQIKYLKLKIKKSRKPTICRTKNIENNFSKKNKNTKLTPQIPKIKILKN